MQSPPTGSRDAFLAKLEQLRMKIDELPEGHRPHLYELAETIRSQFDSHRSRHDQQPHGKEYRGRAGDSIV